MIRLGPATGPRIGSISLYDQPGNNRGFWLAPPWQGQGQGYMSEAFAVINAFWFETLGRPLMRVPKAVENRASRALSLREGMRKVETREDRFVCGPMLKDIWELTREEWLGNRRT